MVVAIADLYKKLKHESSNEHTIHVQFGFNKVSCFWERLMLNANFSSISTLSSENEDLFVIQ